MREPRMDIATVQSATRDAQTALLTAGQAAWAYVQAREPELAKHIGDLGWSDADVSTWLVTRGDCGMSTPIDVVADGRTAELIAAMRKTQHGML